MLQFCGKLFYCINIIYNYSLFIDIKGLLLVLLLLFKRRVVSAVHGGPIF
jgi:hypothetical protein